MSFFVLRFDPNTIDSKGQTGLHLLPARACAQQRLAGMAKNVNKLNGKKASLDACSNPGRNSTGQKTYPKGVDVNKRWILCTTLQAVS
jgi:hypothetical protein